MADGYARATSKPCAVIVHVDVGTQALGPALHNASTGRVPVLIFAGLSPITQEYGLRGSRTEFIHWLQDIPDQKSIVSQYCRYVGEIKTGLNVKQLVNRAIQFATSDPKGPVYLMGAREVMEEEISKPITLDQTVWTPIELGELPTSAVSSIATALVEASDPLIIAGFTGRNHASPPLLANLATLIPGLRVIDAGQSDMTFPFSHRAILTPATGARSAITSADVILVIDTDVPWIPATSPPTKSAKIFHIDVDPLKQNMNLFYIPAVARYRVNSYLALQQLNSFIERNPTLPARLSEKFYREKWETLGESYNNNMKAIANRAAPPTQQGVPTTVSYLTATLKKFLPKDTIWVSEAVTSHVKMSEQIQASLPGSFLTKGGAGLGWNGGASLGIKLSTLDSSSLSSQSSSSSSQTSHKDKFVINITGDGSFLFSHPSVWTWISANYKIPTLTVILNNNGYAAPKHSAKLVRPDGEVSRTERLEEIACGFGGRMSSKNSMSGANVTMSGMNTTMSGINTMNSGDNMEGQWGIEGGERGGGAPDYVKICEGGSNGWFLGEKVETWENLEVVVQAARDKVLGGRSVVLDVWIDG